MPVNAPDLPLVSILINNYNYARFIDEAIDSALAQDYTHVEVIVVDDGSTDDSRARIAAFEGRVTAVFQSNSGQAAAFNAGFAASRGAIVCLLDADDRFRPEKVAAIVAEYQAHPLAEWCFHPLAFFGDRTTEPTAGQFPAGVDIDVRAEMRRGKLRLTAPATSGLTFRRPLLAKLLPMPTEIRITSDNYLKFASLGTSPGVLMRTELAQQRIHASNAYTLRWGASSLRGEIAMMTAVYLRTQFPNLRRFANGLFARGASRHVWNLFTDRRIRRLTGCYVQELSVPERLELFGRTLFNIVRNLVAP